jgi:aldehyde dehydrogenase (NAD+)
VILDDADLGRAVKIGLANAWINGGQTCTAWTRMLVPAARHDEIVEMAVVAAGKYTVGDPADESTRVGPMSSVAQQRRVHGYLERGVADGASVVFGGTGPVDGPVLSVIPYVDEEQAVAIANSTVYGLAGAVFGEPEHALAVAKCLRTGQVDVNGGAFNPMAPFGGYKQSGNGRELGRFGLEEFLEVKSIQR